jgi:CheY-like chemotaxis protein
MRGTGAAHGARPSGTVAHLGIRGRRVLYVDDDPRLRRLVARLLDGVGATCRPAGTHEDAIAILDRDPRIDLAILDFHMPDGPVARLVPRLRTARPRLTVVGTSAADRRSDFAACGVTRFIAKPWSPEDLLRVASL